MKLKRIPYIYHFDKRCHTCISPQREMVEKLYWANLPLSEIMEQAPDLGVSVQSLKHHLSHHALFVHEIEPDEKKIDYDREIDAHKKIIDGIKEKLEKGEQERGDVDDLSKLWKVIGELEKCKQEREQDVNVSLLLPSAIRLITGCLRPNEAAKCYLKLREWLANEEARMKREG